MFWIICAAIALFLLFFFGPSKYNKIFADQHYVEIAIKLARAKEEGLTNAKLELQENDSRRISTTAGLLIIYTVRKEEEKYIHHFSLSVKGSYTPTAVGAPFSIYIAQTMSLDIAKVEFFFSKRKIYHGEIELNEDEHANWAKMEVKPPMVEQIHKQYWQLRDSVVFYR